MNISALSILRVTCVLIFFILICTQSGESARVLGLFPTRAKSHLIIQMEVIKTLIDRGHNVTVVTTLPVAKSNRSFHHVKLPEISYPEWVFTSMIEERKGLMDELKKTSALMDITINASETSLVDLIKSGFLNEEPFELVVLGYFFNDIFMGVAAHFKSPLVIIDTHKPLLLTNSMIGNPSEIFYVPNGLLEETQPLSFFGRVRNALFHILEIAFTKLYIVKMNNIYGKYFPGDKYPPLSDMFKNVSLILQTTHFSEGVIRPEIPALIPIGGIQAKQKPDLLPKELSLILDEATEHGVIYFSLGTNAKSSDRNPVTIKSIYNVFSKLKQKVIWKWEDGEYPGNASNIFYAKWLPQDDILAHPHLRLFISHCGLGSIVESKYHGVPVLAIPLFGDQFGNAKAMVDAGFAVQVNYQGLTEESFEAALKEILENPSYRENIQRFSRLYRDRPMSIRDTAAYWLEYVIRHRGSKHMQSPAVHMSAFAYYGLDVIAFLLLIVYIVFKILSICCCSLICRCRKSKIGGTHKKKKD
ncbi:unnamed protein product [Hermetia illucens]|uniref:UDP-glucuronosyltransferase n=1 Tax=Hermetia illucens TaxID=343691 RepID=A0A7R8UVU3_HERIL|nr:UDP-glycosyltransferase UGT5-like [Hermetia illucens]CAD7087501.1 unnamed protein product [Hermetia illucens]